jgi:acyl carrier protein
MKGAPMREDLIASLRRMIVNDLFVEIAEEQIGLDDGLQSVVGLDSVGFVELRVRCEQCFNVEITDDDYTPENFSSVRRVANLIDRLQAARKSQAGTAVPVRD